MDPKLCNLIPEHLKRLSNEKGFSKNLSQWLQGLLSVTRLLEKKTHLATITNHKAVDREWSIVAKELKKCCNS